MDDRYIRLRSHRISHFHVVSGLRQSHSIMFSRLGFSTRFLRLVSFYEEVMAQNKDTNHYECDQPVCGNFINCGTLLAIALQKSAFKSIAVRLPIPNCRPSDLYVPLYVSPVANRHNATATRFFTGIHSRNLVSFFATSGPTNRTLYSNVRIPANFF